MKTKYKLIFMTIFLLMTAMNCFSAEAESFTVNDLKVIFKQNTSTDIVAASMYLRGGVMNISPDQAGIENLALIVAQKATKRFAKDELNARLEKMNSQITSTSNPDFSSLNLQCVKQNLKNSWEIFTDILLNPAFNEEDVDLERQRLISNIKQTKDNPDGYLTQILRQGFYVNHPYATDVDGTIETVSVFSADDLRSHLQSRIKTSHMLLVVVGNTTRAELQRLVENSFSAIEVGNYKQQLPALTDFDESSIKVVNRELPTSYIRAYFPAPAYGSEESYAMGIACSILRDRLFEEVRTKRGLSYAPAAGYGNSFSNYGYIYVTTVKPDMTIKVMINELDRIKNEQVSEKELNNKLNVFITAYYLANETNQSQANLLARMELSTAGYEAAPKFIEFCKSVTPQIIQATCQKYIENLQFVLLGNPATLAVNNFMY